MHIESFQYLIIFFRVNTVSILNTLSDNLLKPQISLPVKFNKIININSRDQ